MGHSGKLHDPAQPKRGRLQGRPGGRGRRVRRGDDRSERDRDGPASALLIFRLAVGAVLAGALSPAKVVPLLLVVTVGSVVLGFVLSRVIVPLTARIQDVPIAVVVQFCGTFAVWMLAERLHLSGILTVVVFAMASTQRAADMIPARVRIPSYAVWAATTGRQAARLDGW